MMGQMGLVDCSTIAPKDAEASSRSYNTMLIDNESLSNCRRRIPIKWRLVVLSILLLLSLLAHPIQSFAPFSVHERTCTSSASSRHQTYLPPLQIANDPLSSNTNPAPTTASTRKKKLQSFQRYLEVECWKQQPDVRGLGNVLQSLADACKQINRIVQRAQTDELYGNYFENDDAATNIQGETPQKLDVLCNTVVLRAFCGAGGGRSIHAVASEEEDEARCCASVMLNNDGAFSGGDFVAVFDPIDGSKNIDASLPVGTIFGIYRKPHGREELPLEELFYQDGSGLVAAGYCLYSATTVLVMTLGSGVDGFTLDPDTGRFLHTHQDMRIPSFGPIYSFNEANFHDFAPSVQRYLDALKEGSSSVGVRSNARYLGSLVADVHNVLINGGIYGYPATQQNSNGKLRLLYEAAPMAMILEQAGGAASTGTGRILDVTPKNVHERVPTFLGSIENVFELDQFCKYYSDDNEDDDSVNRRG